MNSFEIISSFEQSIDYEEIIIKDYHSVNVLREWREKIANYMWFWGDVTWDIEVISIVCEISAGGDTVLAVFVDSEVSADVLVYKRELDHIV